MAIVDGEPVDAAHSNPAWISKNTDDTAVGDYTLTSPKPAVGASIVSLQREVNSLDSFSGNVPGSVFNVKPVWNNNDVGASTDDLKTRTDLLTRRFSGTVGIGHQHSGVDGDGPPVPSTNISPVPLTAYFPEGSTIVGATGGSTNVTALMGGFSPSTSATVKGAVVTNPQNKTPTLKYASGVNQGDLIKDLSGNEVYGRLTFSVGVWTLTYFTDPAGVETPFSFGVATDVDWFFQVLYNLLDSSNPVYSTLAIIPSLNATADVITATTALQGKTQLSAVAPPDVASAGAAGTANATVANADHTHRGVHTLFAFGNPNLYGDVDLKAGTGISLTQVGQEITIASTSTSGRSGTSAIGSGVKTLAVVFSSTLGSTNYSIVAIMNNLTDALPQFQPIVITTKLATGFTASWNENTDSANYNLEWNATPFA
jgi:hypothetical protein